MSAVDAAGTETSAIRRGISSQKDVVNQVFITHPLHYNT